MKPKANRSILISILLSLPLLVNAQNSNVAPELKQAIQAAIETGFDNTAFRLQNPSVAAGTNGTIVAADASFFGMENVKLTIQLTGSMEVESVEALFPPSTVFNPITWLSRMMDAEKLQKAIPEFLLNNNSLHIESFKLSIKPGVHSFESFTVVTSLDQLTIADFEDVKIRKIKLQLEIRDTDNQKSISGTIAGNMDFINNDVEIAGTISSQKEEFEIEGSVNNGVSIINLINKIGGGSLKKTFEAAAPVEAFEKIEIPSFRFVVCPFKKQFSIHTHASADSLAFEVYKADDGYLFTFTYSPDTKFKFSNISESLSVIDKANLFEHLEVSISNDPKALGLNSAVRSIGLQISSTLAPNEFIKKLLNSNNTSGSSLPVVTFTGSIDSRFNTAFKGRLGLNMDLGNNWKIENVGLSFNYIVGGRSPSLGINGSMIIPVDKTNLRFEIGMEVEPVSAAIGATLNLQSVNEDGELKDWKEPFGIPNLTLAEIGGGFSLSGTTLIDNISFQANLKLGKIPRGEPDRRLIGNANGIIDVDVAQSSIKAEIENLNLLKIIDAFTDKDNNLGEVGKFLNTGINNAEMDISPKDKRLSIKGKATFLSTLNGDVNISAGEEGFTAIGNIDKIAIPVGGIDVFSFTSASNANVGPGFNIELNGDKPQIKMSGKMKILGMDINKSDVSIDEKGFAIETMQQMLGGLATATIRLSGQNFLNAASMNIHGDLKLSEVFNYRAEVINYITKNTDANLGKFVGDAIPGLIIKSCTFDAGLDGLTTGLNLNISFELTLGGVSRLFNASVPITLDFNNPEKIPGLTADFATAIGKAILNNSASLGKLVLDAGINVAKEAVTVAAEGAIKFGEETKKGWLSLNSTFEDWLKERKFDAPVSGGPEEFVRPGYRHFELTFKGIEVIKAYENNGDDIYGAVTFNTSPSATTYWANGTNPNLFGVSENDNFRDTKAGAVIGNENTKHFYVKNKSNSTVYVKAKLYENDIKIVPLVSEDNVIQGESTPVDLTNFISQKEGYLDFITKYEGFIGLGKGESQWRVRYKITADAMVSGGMLLEKVRSNNVDGLNTLIRKGGDIKEVGSEALSEAINNRNKNIIALLSQYEVKAFTNHLDAATAAPYDPQLVYLLLNIADPSSITVNHINAAIANNADWLAKAMLDKGAEPDHSTIHLALEKKMWPLLVVLFTKLPPDATDMDYALHLHDEFAVEFLLNQNVPVSTANLTLAIQLQMWNSVQKILQLVKPDESTFIACANVNNTYIFSCLCKKGVLISSIEPARISIDKNNIDILSYCFQNGVKADSLIIYSVNNNKIEAVKVCVAYGASPQAGVMPAIIRGYYEMVALFIDTYSASATPAEYIETAVIYSKRGSHARIASLLLKHGANPDLYVEPKTGNTLLHVVSKRCRIYTPDPYYTIGTFNGKPLHFFIKRHVRRDWDMMAALIEGKADLKKKNSEGFIPLHLAVKRCRRAGFRNATIKMVEAGADINACTNKKKSVLQIAGGWRIKKYLKSKGALKKLCH